MLALIILAYQRIPAIRWLTRQSIRLHHAVRPNPQRRPCPLAGNCSATGLASARTIGWAALPAILANISLCGPRIDSMEWCIGVSGDCWHEHGDR